VKSETADVITYNGVPIEELDRETLLECLRQQVASTRLLREEWQKDRDRLARLARAGLLP
jgi:hypothetical protein